MRVVIIQDPDIISITAASEKFLRSKSKEISKNTFIIYNNENVLQNIANEYAAGVRNFVLTIISSQIIQYNSIFSLYPDAQFVSPSSTVPILRGAYPNLYFTSASNVYINYVVALFKSLGAVLVYANPDNPFVADIIIRFTVAGVPTFDVSDIGWQQYNILVLLSINTLIWNEVVAGLNPTTEYNFYGLEIFPSESLIFPTNVINVSLLFPSTSVIPQTNSYWNYLNRADIFSNAGAGNNVYPLLVNQCWNQLINSYLISSTLQLNGFYYSRYLPLYKFDIIYNINNQHIYNNSKIVWLSSKEYIDQYSTFNLNYIKRHNRHIAAIKVICNSLCLIKQINKYYAFGYRKFVLDVPGDMIKTVQENNCYENSVFICTRSGDPTIRTAGSKFLFALCTDNTIIDTRIVGAVKVSLGELICVMGTSNNVNIEDFKAHCQLRAVKYIDIKDINTIPNTTKALISVGNDADYEVMFNYVVQNISNLPKLNIFWKYGDYITQAQFDKLYSLGQRGDMVILNFSSCQPFLDSYYSIRSRPPYLINSIPYLYLPNMMFQFSLPFLYDFGYLIDI